MHIYFGLCQIYIHFECVSGTCITKLRLKEIWGHVYLIFLPLPEYVQYWMINMVPLIPNWRMPFSMQSYSKYKIIQINHMNTSNNYLYIDKLCNSVSFKHLLVNIVWINNTLIWQAIFFCNIKIRQKFHISSINNHKMIIYIKLSDVLN